MPEPVLRIVLLVLSSMTWACDRGDLDQPAPAIQRAAVPAQRAPVLTRALSAVPAFDLVSAGGQALLVWADGTAVRGITITAEGKVAQERKLADVSHVIEVAAAVGHGVHRLGVAWMAGDASIQLFTTVGDTRTLITPVATAVTTVSTTRSERRGRMALVSGPDGVLTLFAQGPEEPCEDGALERCATFAIRKLPADGSVSRRPVLAVPHPCSVPIAGFAVLPGHWQYAVCNIEAGRERTTLFTTRAHPSYAQVLHLLEGCDPTGSALVGDKFWLTAQCGSQRAGVVARGVDVLEVPTNLSQRSVVCDEDGTMMLSLATRERAQLAPTGQDLIPPVGLAAVLPAAIAPTGSRAVVIGQGTATLAVAAPSHDRVEIRRYGCSGSLLLPLP